MRETVIRGRKISANAGPKRGGPGWFRLAAVGVLAVALLPATASGEDGNIGTNAIEIANDANLYPQPATGCTGDAFNATLNANAFDWVKDCLPNADLTAGTNAAAAKGHWNGFRVLDGFAGNDQDIFLTGGKENDHESWNPGPGSVGSSKYDITQAYLANNSTDAFFGMERRGNNGTTAFDWEFNKYAPDPDGAFPDYVPNRSEGDVLLTFEMQGAGNSGSATPFRFVYNDPDIPGDGTDPPENVLADIDFDGAYESVPITGITAVINDGSIPSAPWGAVSSQGNWSTAGLERFKFAEAKVPLSLIGVDPGSVCDDVSRFVQVRTRASSTENSDLKDLTKIFNFDFSAAPLTVTAAKGAPDGAALTVPINATVVNGAAGTTLAHQWQYSETGSAGSWSNIATETSEDISSYSAFETHDTSPDSTTFAIEAPNAASGSYAGKVWTVFLRLQVTRTVGSTACGVEHSASVTVKKVTAVDP